MERKMPNSWYTTTYDDDIAPAGWHPAMIESVERREAKTSGNEYLWIGFRLLLTNRRLFGLVMLVDKKWGYGRLQTLCNALDRDASTWAAWNPHTHPDALLDVAAGKAISLKIVHSEDEWQGERRKKAQVQAYRPLTPAERRQCVDRHDPGGASPTPPRSPFDDDDVPF
jgi:hypothetical protein